MRTRHDIRGRCAARPTPRLRVLKDYLVSLHTGRYTQRGGGLAMQDEVIRGDHRSELQSEVFSQKRSARMPWTLIVAVAVVSAVAFVGVMYFQFDLQGKLAGVARTAPQPARQSTAPVSTPRPEAVPRVVAPDVAKPPPVIDEGGQCPPGQVAGFLESERTGRRVICHVQSFAQSPRPSMSQTRPVAPRVEQRSVPRQVPYQPTTADTCARLSERIKHLDSLARLPQSGPEQDRITAERRSARDQQFRLRCR